jgi:hypothetical protein
MSFIIGVFFGLALMMVMCWGAFSTRTFIFSACLKDEIRCRRSDYYNNPGNAIREEGMTDSDILTVVDDKLYYTRVPKTHCRPMSNQEVHIFNPQQCKFEVTLPNGKTESFVGKNGFFESPHYTGTFKGEEIGVTTTKNCNPIRSTTHNVSKGTPLAKWDA